MRSYYPQGLPHENVDRKNQIRERCFINSRCLPLLRKRHPRKRPVLVMLACACLSATPAAWTIAASC
ncbi:MAG TPA: hypothetical protein VHL31_04915, partial [Geminicoccus sp.]|uniref:hypothetical protein n=1 Tax=Geminicoccus sp. TaxID=2024832 RepID=UPI002E310FBF